MQPCQCGLLETYMIFIHGDIILTKFDSSVVVSFQSPNSLQMYDPFTTTVYDHLKYYFVNWKHNFYQASYAIVCAFCSLLFWLVSLRALNLVEIHLGEDF